MSEPTEILYPRGEAQFFTKDLSKEEAKVQAEIDDIKASKLFQRYEQLLKMKLLLESHKKYFRCWNCGCEQPSSNLKIYNFVSYANNADETRYDDRNVICPTCGKFSYITDKNNGIKETKEVLK